MDVILYLFVIIAHAVLTKAAKLPIPISLGVLNNDFKHLSDACISGDMSELTSLKYLDEIKFDIQCQQTVDGTEKKSILIVAGISSVASSFWTGYNQQLKLEREDVQLFFYSSFFYYDNPLSGKASPIDDIDERFITHYDPVESAADILLEVQYSSVGNFIQEITEKAFSQVQYESYVIDSRILDTYYYMTNGSKLKMSYDKTRNVLTITGYVYIVNFSENTLIAQRHNSIEFDVSSSSSHQLNRITNIFAIRAGIPMTPKIEDTLKLDREILLKDMIISRPLNPTIGAAGGVKYKEGALFAIDTLQRNEMTYTRMNGLMFTPDGQIFKSLCLYEPVANDIKFIPLFFSCDKNPENRAVALLHKYADYISIPQQDTSVEALLKSYKSIQPYIEYISYDRFVDTMKVLTHALKYRCVEKGTARIRYHLFADISLVFICKSMIASLGTLTLWEFPDLSSVFGLEDFPGVEFHSDTNEFRSEGFTITQFKLRQIYHVIPGELPLGMEYVSTKGTHISTALYSLEYDMESMRQHLLKKKFRPKSGAVYIDQDALFYGKLIKEYKKGKKVKVLSVNAEVMDSRCLKNDCLVNYEIKYNGDMLYDGVLAPENMASMVFWPKHKRRSTFHKKLLITFKDQYVKMTTFRNDMKELTGLLNQHCEVLTKKTFDSHKLTFAYSYFASTNSAIGYYDCQLKYIFFYSDFKAIMHPGIFKDSFVSNVLKKKTKVGRCNLSDKNRGKKSQANINKASGTANDLKSQNNVIDLLDDEKSDDEEIWFQWVVTEEKVLRNKYHHLIVEDVLYFDDSEDGTLNSRTMFLDEVYALKMLSSEFYSDLKIGNAIKKILRSGAEVSVYEEENN